MTGDPRDSAPGERGDIGYWCSVLTPSAHGHCRYTDCVCTCHLPVERGALDEGAPRPHSYPRLDWQNRRPPGWHEAERLGKPLHRKRGFR